MSELLSRESCVNHPGRTAEARCDHCGNAMCARCTVEALAGPEEYCSRECADEAETDVFKRFVGGLDSPYSTGVRLWWRSLVPLLGAVWPVALLITLIFWLGLKSSTEAAASTVPTSVGIVLLLLCGYGIMVTGTTISQQYTGFIRGNVHTWALERMVPWALTWALVTIATLVGYLLLIIPGFIVALRLFWADEYALSHGDGPLRALEQSWEITKGEVGEVFVFQLVTGFLLCGVAFAGLGVVWVVMEFASFLGPLGVPFAAFVIPLVLFFGYAMTHSVELSKFYGMRAMHLRGKSPVGAVSLGLGKSP